MFARVRHSIRAQYSLATALFLLMVLGLFYVGGRVVLVHLVREAEQQVKEIGLDISRLAYRNAERAKQKNLVVADALADALARGETSEALLASNEFSRLSLVAVYRPDGTFLSGAAVSRTHGIVPLRPKDLAPYAARLAAWVTAAAHPKDGGQGATAVGILRVMGVSHYISLTAVGGDSPRYVVVGSAFDADSFAAQVNESFGGVDIRMTNRRVDVALTMRDLPKPTATGSHSGGFRFEPMLSEALNFYSGGFWDFGGNPFEAVFAIRDIAGNAITMIAVSLPKTFSDVTRAALGRLTFFIAMVGIVLILPVFWFQGRVLLNPLTRMTELIRRLGERHRDIDCPRLEWRGKDEFAHLAASVNKMLETISARTVALTQLEARQRALIEAVPDALAVFDRRGAVASIIKHPEGVAAIPGFNVGETVAKPVYGEKGALDFAEALADAFEKGRGSVRLSTMGGRHFEVRFSRMDEHFTLAVVRDVTREVAEHVKRVAAEERAHDSSKRESLTLFAAGIAHDVNNVLSVVLSTAEAAFADSPNSELETDMDVIRDAVKRGSNMTKELMAYAGESKIRLVRTNSNLIVEDMRMLIEHMTGDNVSVSYSLAKGLPDVDVDLNQFWKVIFNIIKNANESFGGQPGRIVLSTAPLEMTEAKAAEFISEHPLQSETGVLFSVFNDGPSIPPDVLPRLFDPYVSTKSLGRGLGLATVRTIVEAHGGALCVKSRPKHGTTFQIYLPPSHLPKVAEPVERFSATPEGASLPNEVLIVDNDEAILKTCSILLKTLKITPHVAHDRRESLAILRRRPDQIGVVLLDANLGGIDTLRLLDAFRLASPKMRILISSGSSEEMIEKLFANHPFDGFLGKPYSLAELREALQAAAAKSR